MKVGYKKIGLLVSTVSTLVLSSSIVFASTDQPETGNSVRTTYQTQQITNIQDLIQRAKQGISDIKNGGPLTSETTQSFTGDKGKVTNFIIQHYKTAQLLKTSNDSSGNTINTYAVTNISQYYDQSQYNSSSDSGLDTTAYSTIYIDDVYNGSGAEFWKLVGSDGGWSLDNNITLKNASVTLGASGIPTGDYGVLWPIVQTQSYPETSTTFNITAPNWYAVAAQVGPASYDTVIGMSSSCDVYRNGTKIATVSLTNDYMLQI